MALPKRQNALNWITQGLNIALGRRVRKEHDDWMLGPIGFIEEQPEQFIERLAHENNLEVRRNRPGSGFLPNFENWGFEINPRVAAFYNQTSDYNFEVECTWEPIFASCGYLFSKLFIHRIQQFNLPKAHAGEKISFRSDVIEFINDQKEVVYTIWLRIREDSPEVVFYGIYAACQFPSGEFGVKSVYPLPQGNATVLLKIIGDENGNLTLDSSGKKYGDPGFYFVVKDWMGGTWKHLIPYFRQKIYVYEDEYGELRADHTMTIWNCKMYSISYRIFKKPGEE